MSQIAIFGSVCEPHLRPQDSADRPRHRDGLEWYDMQDWNPWHEAIKAAYSVGASVIVLALTWFVGSRLTYRWNVRQKSREFQLSASHQFYVAYGEFFAVWKLWNRLDRAAAEFQDRRWELHKREAAAEAIGRGIS